MNQARLSKFEEDDDIAKIDTSKPYLVNLN